MNTATLDPPTVPTTTAALAPDLDAHMAANREAINAAAAMLCREPTRLVTYSRLSADPDGDEEGVTEQRDDSILYAERHYPAAVIVGHYTDDDRSAYKDDVVREDFERMIRDAQAGVFDAIIVRDSDRLYRRLDDLVRITKELTPRAQVIARKGGEIDLSTASGILHAQMMGAVAEHESRRKAERIRDNARHRAQGGVMTASNRPFGWAWRQPCDAGPECSHKPRTCLECRRAKNRKCTHKVLHRPGERPLQGSRAGLTVHPDEAEYVANIYERFANGESLYSIAKWLREEEVTGTWGAPMKPEQIRSILQNPRNAGLVAHNGRLVANAKDGSKIVSVDLWQQVQLIFKNPGRRTAPGRPANTALTGIAVCGKCGGTMAASNKHSSGRRYPEGQSGPEGGKRAPGKVRPVYICSRNLHLTKGRGLVDDYVLGAVGEFLVANAATLRAAAVNTGEGAAERLAREEVGRISEQIKGYQRLANQMAPEDLVPILNGLRADLVDAERRAAVVSSRPAVARLLAAEDVAEGWQALIDAEDRAPLRAVLRELLDRVTINPASAGVRVIDEAVVIEWQAWAREAVDAV